MPSDLRDLGMNRRIERRDFLNGVALGVAGAWTARHASGVGAAGRRGPV